MDDCVAITLFRHGLTKWNEKKAYIGSTDLPLSKQGKADLNLVTTEEHQLIFSSPMKRCIQTVDQLFPNKTAIPIQEFREIDFGDWEGKTYNELKEVQLYRNWLDDPFDVTPPHGESLNDFKLRVEQGFEKVKDVINKNAYSKIAIVTHGGVIRQLLSMLSGQPESFFQWQVPHGGGYQLTWKIDNIKGETRCMSLQEVPIMEKLAGSKNIIN